MVKTKKEKPPPRPLEEVIKDIKDAAEDVRKTEQAHEDARRAEKAARIETINARTHYRDLKDELDDLLGEEPEECHGEDY